MRQIGLILLILFLGSSLFHRLPMRKARNERSCC